MEKMWDGILTNPLQGREFREFRSELMKYLVGYNYGSANEYEIKTTGGYKAKICVQTGTTNNRYISYAESKISVIKPPMNSPQDYVEETQNPGVPGRD